jgi:hypothetical protein
MRLEIAALALALLGACNEKEEIAEKVEERADKRADAMEEAGRSMTNALQQNVVEQQARTVREAGQERAEAIRESELNADALTDAQKKRLVAGDQGTPTKNTR